MVVMAEGGGGGKEQALATHHTGSVKAAGEQQCQELDSRPLHVHVPQMGAHAYKGGTRCLHQPNDLRAAHATTWSSVCELGAPLTLNGDLRL